MWRHEDTSKMCFLVLSLYMKSTAAYLLRWPVEKCMLYTLLLFCCFLVFWEQDGPFELGKFMLLWRLMGKVETFESTIVRKQKNWIELVIVTALGFRKKSLPCSWILWFEKYFSKFIGNSSQNLGGRRYFLALELGSQLKYRQKGIMNDWLLLFWVLLSRIKTLHAALLLEISLTV